MYILRTLTRHRRTSMFFLHLGSSADLQDSLQSYARAALYETVFGTRTPIRIWGYLCCKLWHKSCKNTCCLKGCTLKHCVFMCFLCHDASGSLKMTFLGPILEPLSPLWNMYQNKVKQMCKFNRFWGPFLDLILSLWPLFLRSKFWVFFSVSFWGSS